MKILPYFLAITLLGFIVQDPNEKTQSIKAKFFGFFTIFTAFYFFVCGLLAVTFGVWLPILRTILRIIVRS